MSNFPWTSRDSHSGLTSQELAKAHPGGQGSGSLYHNIEHTLRVERFAYQFALRRGRNPGEANFLATVAVLHDWDPERNPGTPASAERTIKLLEDDFNGGKALMGGNTSALKSRLGWNEVDMRIALAIIKRTDFPFGDTQRDAYVARLRAIPSHLGQRFALEEGPLMSEYADKSSYYVAAPFRSAFAAVQGLVKEMTAVGVKNMSVASLNTPVFMASIGIPKSFDADLYAAEQLGFSDLALPGRESAFTSSQAGRFGATSAGFSAFNSATAAGSSPEAAYGSARAAVLAALRNHRKMHRNG